MKNNLEEWKSCIKQYAQKNFPLMFRKADGILKYDFIVPGSIYTDSLWDWDSWLTDTALRQLGENQGIENYEKGCILNFLDRCDDRGRIPIFIMPHEQQPDFATYGDTNIHKPCLAQHAAFVIRENGNDVEWLRPHFGALKKYIGFYMEECHHESGLYFWIDDGAVGVDNDPCTFYRPDRSSGSIFLNCLMYKELLAMCEIGTLLGEATEIYANEAEKLKEAIRKNCYDERNGFYYSVDLNLRPVDKNCGRHCGAPRNWDTLIQRIDVWSGFLAMWSGIATPEQVERMVRENLYNKRSFWSEYGVCSLGRSEKMFQIIPSGNPSCWLGPIWGIANYMTFRGLLRYGYEGEARELAEKSVRLFGEDIKQTGEMHEYYDPDTGKPVYNAGFQSWNLLVLNMIAWLDGEEIITEF